MDGDAIAHARKGYYPEASLESMEPERIQRYFIATPTGYRIDRRIQELVIFARQDLVRDPPFLRLDLISCRNVLIYFKAELQQHLFQLFHYALNPGAWLFLGSSEVVGSASNLFQQRHKARLFQRNDLAPPPTPRLIQLQSRVNVTDLVKPMAKPPLDPGLLLREQLARSYAPPSVLVDEDNKLVELFGETQAYFRLGEGSAQLDVLRIIRPDLRTELRALIHRVRQGGAESCTGQAHYPDGADTGFRLCVGRVLAQGGDSRALRLSFEEVQRRAEERKPLTLDGKPEAAETRIAELQDELSSNREHLQTVIEELETSNEELQSMNEELQASGEELQASNEELATSNEELQATNEELTTVNDELQAKTQQVAKTLEDLENIQDATSVAVVVLDKDLLISRFNASAVRHIGLTDADYGRNLAALPIRLPQREIQEPLHAAIAGDSVEPFQLGMGDSVYQIEIRPYLDNNNKVQGAVLSMADITELKDREMALREANQLFETFAAADQAAIWVQEPEFGPFRFVNPAFQYIYGLDPQMLLRDPDYLFKVMHAEDARELRQAHLATKDKPWSILTRIIHPRDGTTHWLRTRGFPLRESGRLRYVVGFTFDVTAELATSTRGDIDLARLFDLLVDADTDGVVGFASDGRILFVNGAVEALLGLKPDGLVGKDARAILRGEEAEQLATLIADDKPRRSILERAADGPEHAESADGPAHPMEIVLSSEPVVRGGEAAAIALFRNPTGHRAAMRQLQIADSVYRTTRDGVMVLDNETRIILTNPSLRRILDRGDALLLGTVPDIFPGRTDASAFSPEIAEALKKAGRWTGEIRVPVSGGDFAVLESEVSALRRASLDDLGHYMVRITDITQRRAYEDTIYRQANFDALTGLPNRVLLEDRLVQEILHARREGDGVTLMFIDLDRFKEINDSLGHAAGDTLLAAVAGRIGGLVRDSDTLCRFGGDEFVLMLPKFKRSHGPEMTARSILTILEKPFAVHGEEVFTSASIGIAVFPQDGADSSELLRNADAAMYQAKAVGRNQFAFFRASMNDSAARRVKLDAELRKALAKHEFRVHYQPVVSAQSGRPCLMEALIRWQHGDQGLLPPSSFIPHAEESNLIRSLTELTLTDARRRLADWRRRFDPELRVSVNLSPSLFRQMCLKDLFSAEPDPDLDGLMIEITESLFMDIGEVRVASNLKWLCAHGAGVALDDFGTGYSSLAYVRDFPVDVIKIDRAFVEHVAEEPRDAALVQAAITMAHGVGALVTAEGVETKLQAETVSRLGADHLQGFLFAKAMSPEAAEAYLNARIGHRGEAVT